MANGPATRPPQTSAFVLSYPAPHVLLITINRPKAMNSIPYVAHWEADKIMEWYDADPELRVAIVTGAGDKAFCAGQDLIDANELAKRRYMGEDQHQTATMHPKSGFMGISRRAGKKPVIAAVNGFAMGGGFEICLGCDMVVAAPRATFALPEASRGLYAAAGGLSRLVRVAGIYVASEVAMTGRILSAQEAQKLLLVNKVSKTNESVVDEAIELAAKIGQLSPDAIIVTRHGLRESWEQASVERASQLTEDRYGKPLRDGENIRIGLEAFANKQKPNWVPSKL